MPLRTGSPFSPFSVLRQEGSRRLIATMSLFFLVVCAVGVLRPIKNALALDGLGATGFYKVYIVSAAVVLFVPLYNRLADHVPWRWLIPGVALFFASHLLAFRIAFREGSALLGLLFYGWYDLFTAVLVAQFFVAAQLYFEGRNAKEAFPLVIAGGAVGASLGSAVTALFAHAVGTVNLLLVAAGLITVFGLGLPYAWASDDVRRASPKGVRKKEVRVQELRAIAANPHARLIAASVFLTVIVKQLIDYQFNAITLEVFRTRDAVSAFQGAFNAATQWLPIVAVLALRPLIRRWGIQAAVLLLPATMMAATLGIAAWWSLWAVMTARAVEGSLRYSAERTGREVLYIPLPDEIKLKAKTYIDVAIENGLAKVAAAALIFALLTVMTPRQLAYVSAATSVLWVGVAFAIRREYVRALARAITGRFASLRGLSASVADASTRPILQRALAGGDLQAAFTVDLLGQADAPDIEPFATELHQLLSSSSEEIRLRALVVLAKSPQSVDVERVRACLTDASADVRQAAVRLLCLARPEERESILGELLAAPEAAVRTAALTCLALEEISVDGARLVRGPYVQRPADPAGISGEDARRELALAAGVLGADSTEAERILVSLLQDPDPSVASAALWSAGLVGSERLYPAMIVALGTRGTREAARDALVRQGARAVPALSAYLMDRRADPAVRRNIPAVLARIPHESAVRALLESYAAPETDQFLDFRTLKALNRLRAHHPELVFEDALVGEAIDREVGAARRYAAARGALEAIGSTGPGVELLRRALAEGWRERRESVFRSLGLLHPPAEVHRCYAAVVSGSPARRANGMEWLEETTGRARFAPIQDLLDRGDSDRRGGMQHLLDLWTDQDLWIARCALVAAAELRLPETREGLERLTRGGTELEIQSLATSLLLRDLDQPIGLGRTGEEPMNVIEKVFLLQRVDLLEGARSSDLALLASIAEELEADAGAVLIQRGDPTAALYVVIRGAVELEGLGGPPVTASDGMSFGSWALIEDAASLVDARVVHPAHLLRITRDDFHALLADHPELGVGLLQGIARRLRSLVSFRLSRIHEDDRVDESEVEEVQKLVRAIEGVSVA